jgi:hypothetical protein
MIFVPDSQTPEERRIIPMSDRVYELLRTRAAAKPTSMPTAVSIPSYFQVQK